MKTLPFSLALSLPLLSPALAQSPDAAHQTGDALVVYSAGIERCFVDDKDSGLARALAMLDQRLLELPRDFDAHGFPAEGIQFAHDLLTGRFCLRAGMQDPTDSATLRAQLTLECRDESHASELAQTLGSFLAMTGAPLRAARDGFQSIPTPAGMLTFGVDATGAAPQFRVALGRGQNEAFSFPRTGLPGGVEPTFFARYDGRELAGLAQAITAGMGSEGQIAWRVIEVLGLVGEDATPRSWATGNTPERGVSVARVEGYEAWARSHGLFVEAPLVDDDFARVPSDATAVSMRQFKPGGLVSLLDRFEPGTTDRALEMMSGMIGVDLRANLLNQLGDTVGVYLSSSTGGGGLMSAVAFVEVDDAEQVAGALARVGAFLQGAARQRLQGRVAFSSWTSEEVPCTTLTFPGLPVPLEVSYALTDDALLCTLNRGALRTALAQATRGSSILDHPRLAGLAPESRQGLMGFGFLDTPFYLERGYGPASFVASAVANFMRSPYESGREVGDILPTIKELAKGAHPAVCLVRVRKGDLVQIGLYDRSWAVNATALAGTPMSSAYIGVATTAIISAISIPKLMSARTSANETAAIATLRALSAAQQQMQAFAGVDTDADGAGEYAFFGELSGARPLRVGSSRGTAWGLPGKDNLNPPFLSAAFGALIEDGTGAVVVERSGYFYKLWLAGADENGRVPGVAESGSGWRSRPPATSAENGSLFWCCYAWPVKAGETGSRAFFINQAGDIYQCASPRGQYSGLPSSGGNAPDFDAALRVEGDLASEVLDEGEPSRDGSRWVLVR